MLQVGDIVTARFNYLLTGIVTKIENFQAEDYSDFRCPFVSVRWFHNDSDVVYRIDSIKKVS
jgi:hypothetical protein